VPSEPRRPLVPTAPVPGPNSGSLAQRAPQKPLQEVAAPEPIATPGFFANRAPVGKITGAIAKVMAEVGTIRKGGFNEFHRYNYARMEDLLHAITPLMGKNGLAVFQNEFKVEMIEGNRVAVSYDFIVTHESGESFPSQRFTGMAMARDRKGNFDDKALNKCHTTARKYFLLGLFQVPAGDFDDPDEDETNANQRQEPVPGPGLKEITPEAKARASEAMIEESIPHKLAVPAGTTADQWANRFLKSIGTATTRDEVLAWEANNDGFLQRISDGYPAIYEMIGAAMERRLTDLSAPKEPSLDMPDPKADPVAALNWVAAQLQDFVEYPAGENFWNQVVAPREGDFQQPDWEMLLQEWQRFETKFPQVDPPA